MGNQKDIYGGPAKSSTCSALHPTYVFLVADGRKEREKGGWVGHRQPLRSPRGFPPRLCGRTEGKGRGDGGRWLMAPRIYCPIKKKHFCFFLFLGF